MDITQTWLQMISSFCKDFHLKSPSATQEGSFLLSEKTWNAPFLLSGHGVSVGYKAIKQKSSSCPSKEITLTTIKLRGFHYNITFAALKSEFSENSKQFCLQFCALSDLVDLKAT